MLPPKRRYSFEFRHPSWYSPRIMRALSKENISLCISDHHDAPAPWKRTADLSSSRSWPGRSLQGTLSAGALADWAKRIRSWKSQGCDVFVFFDNDQKSAAPMDALKLKQLLRPTGCRSASGDAGQSGLGQWHFSYRNLDDFLFRSPLVVGRRQLRSIAISDRAVHKGHAASENRCASRNRG